MKLRMVIIFSLLLCLVLFSGCSVQSIAKEGLDHSAFPVEIRTDEVTKAPVSELESDQMMEAQNEVLYGSLSPEEEATVCQVALDHTYEVFDEVFSKERRAFEKEDLIAVVDPAVHWGECFRHGASKWMEYTKKYGLEEYPDRIASVGIEVRPSAEGSTLGYSVFLVKPLNTDTWIIVNYGF